MHGVNVVKAQRNGVIQTADAAFTQEAQLACAILTADCLPILITNKQGTQVAAVHAGWRSLVDGIIERTVEVFDCFKHELLVFMGPAIGLDYFEVGLEVRQRFIQGMPNAIDDDELKLLFRPSVRKQGHYYADIYQMAIAHFSAIGINNVYGGNHCTYRQQEQFYSYRRDNVTGRMASLIYID